MQKIINDCMLCGMCKTWKPLIAFTINRELSSGHRNTCYECYRAYARAYRRKRYHSDPAFRERQLKAVRKWQQVHAREYNAYQREQRRMKKAATLG